MLTNTTRRPNAALGERLLLGSVIALFAGGVLAAATHQSLVLPDVTIIDGNGGRPLTGMTVVIVGDRITDVFPVNQKGLPSGATVLDVRGGYVTPGLVDAHVHLSL